MQELRRLLGVITIGQTPRPDLTAPLARLAASCRIAIRGALDGLSESEVQEVVGQSALTDSSSYPLVTSLSSGTRITVEESALVPLVQKRIDELDRQGALLHLLLCAGPFAELTSVAPLLRPFDLAVRVLREIGIEQIGVVVPTSAQSNPAARKWTRAGFDACIWSLEEKSPAVEVDEWVVKHYTDDALRAGSIVVFDYVGYPASVLAGVRARLGAPVMDLGAVAIAVAEALL
jgi:protein AroM